jgi:hypothetical protein
MSDHGGHDVEPYAEAFDTETPQVHEGILWCHDCEVDFVPCDHPSPQVTLHHRDAIRISDMETLQIPAFCNECETELVVSYGMNFIKNARRTDD